MKYTIDVLQIEPITIIVGVTNEIKQPIDQIISHWYLDNIDIWSVPLDFVWNVRICLTKSDQNMLIISTPKNIEQIVVHSKNEYDIFVTFSNLKV